MIVKLSATDNRRNDLSFLMFYGKDNFKLGEERFDPDESKHIYQRDVNKMSWGNWGMALNYRLSTTIGDLKIQPYVSKAFSSDTEENMDDNGSSGSLTATTEVKPSVFQAGMRETFTFPILKGFGGEAGLQQTWYDYKERRWKQQAKGRYTFIGIPIIVSHTESHSVTLQVKRISISWL